MNEAEFAWLSEHSPEIFRKYAGKWIAVHNEEVIAVGDTATEVARIADQKCPAGGYLLEAVDSVGDSVFPLWDQLSSRRCDGLDGPSHRYETAPKPDLSAYV